VLERRGRGEGLQVPRPVRIEAEEEGEMTDAVKALVEAFNRQFANARTHETSGGTAYYLTVDGTKELLKLAKAVELESLHTETVAIPQGETCEGDGFRCPCLDNGAGYEYGPMCGLARFKDGEEVYESLDEKELDGKFFRRAALRSAECRARYGFSGKE